METAVRCAFAVGAHLLYTCLNKIAIYFEVAQTARHLSYHLMRVSRDLYGVLHCCPTPPPAPLLRRRRLPCAPAPSPPPPALPCSGVVAASRLPRSPARRAPARRALAPGWTRRWTSRRRGDPAPGWERRWTSRHARDLARQNGVHATWPGRSSPLVIPLQVQRRTKEIDSAMCIRHISGAVNDQQNGSIDQ
ncbi:hypothetical protein EJB05_36338, partial [Eragrostis curvula]